MESSARQISKTELLEAVSLRRLAVTARLQAIKEILETLQDEKADLTEELRKLNSFSPSAEAQTPV